MARLITLPGAALLVWALAEHVIPAQYTLQHLLAITVAATSPVVAAVLAHEYMPHGTAVVLLLAVLLYVQSRVRTRICDSRFNGRYTLLDVEHIQRIRNSITYQSSGIPPPCAAGQWPARPSRPLNGPSADKSCHEHGALAALAPWCHPVLQPSDTAVPWRSARHIAC